MVGSGAGASSRKKQILGSSTSQKKEAFHLNHSETPLAILDLDLLIAKLQVLLVSYDRVSFFDGCRTSVKRQSDIVIPT